MTSHSNAPAQTAAPSKSDDDFGQGLFDEPVAKPAARVAPAPAAAPARAAAPVKLEPKSDEDDGFGAGLI